MKLELFLGLAVLAVSKRLNPAADVKTIRAASEGGAQLLLSHRFVFRLFRKRYRVREVWEYRRIRAKLSQYFFLPTCYAALPGLVLERRVPYRLSLDEVAGQERLRIIRALISHHIALTAVDKTPTPVHGDLWAGNVILSSQKLLPIVIDVDPATCGRGRVWLDPLTLILHNPSDGVAGRWVIAKFFDREFDDYTRVWFGPHGESELARPPSPSEICRLWITEFASWSGWKEEDLWQRIEEAVPSAR